jgi:signal transduction histidine kinase
MPCKILPASPQWRIFSTRGNTKGYLSVFLLMLLKNLRSSLTSRLSKQIGGWVFLGILGVEAFIFLPSAYRRKEEQLEIMAMKAAVRIETLQVISPELPVFVDQLKQFQLTKQLRGAALYNPRGEMINQFGELTTLSFSQAQAQQRQLHHGRPWLYEIALPVQFRQEAYYLLLILDASVVAQDLVAFSGRILVLVLLISVSVTILLIGILNQQLIYPILRLKADMYRSGDTLAKGETLTQFSSQSYQIQNELLEVMQAFYQSHMKIAAAIVERDLSEANLQQTAAQLEITLKNLQQTQAQLVHNEKMSSLGQLGAGFAHEINNPINFIEANLQHVHQYSQDLLTLVAQYQQEVSQPSIALQTKVEEIDLEFIQQDMPSLVESMQSGASRIRDLVVSFRSFVRLDEADQKMVDIHEGLESSILLVQNRLNATPKRPEIQIQRHYGQMPDIFCYPKHLNQVFMSLLQNAIEAIDRLAIHQSDPQPIIQIKTMVDTTAVVIEIIDNGIGIEFDIVTKIFDPFFTTKDVGQGMGLGLTNSYQIIRDMHQGELTCQSVPQQGTILTIRLPK